MFEVALMCFAILKAGSAVMAEESKPSVVAIEIHHGRVIVPAGINGSKNLTFLLDTACTIPTLHPELVDELGLNPSGRVRIQGIAGIERAPTYRGVVFDLGSTHYKPARVASIPSERDDHRHYDGVIGSGFFEDFLVSLDSKSKRMELQPAKSFSYNGGGQVLPLQFKDEIPVISAAIQLAGGKVIEGEFEIDTGCDSGICLGEPFVRTHAILESVKHRTSEKFGVGGSIDTRDGRIPLLKLGDLQVPDAQADFFLDGSPVDEPLAGHIGMGVLGRYKIIFDYQRKRLIMEAHEASSGDHETPGKP